MILVLILLKKYLEQKVSVCVYVCINKIFYTYTPQHWEWLFPIEWIMSICCCFYTFFLFFNVSIISIITFITGSAHKVLIRTIKFLWSSTLNREQGLASPLEVKAQESDTAKQQEIQIIMSPLNSLENVHSWFQMFWKSNMHLGILTERRKRTKQMEHKPTEHWLL